MTTCGGANVFGWRNYALNPPPRRDLLLEMHGGGPKFLARPCELDQSATARVFWWRLTGIAKEQLEPELEERGETL